MESADHPPSRLGEIATRWTLLRRAGAEAGESAIEARRALVLRYLPAIRRYVAAIMTGDPRSEDLAQDIAVRLMAGDFAGADPQRGRFRDLLKTAIRNMIRNDWAKQKRRRTSPLEIAEPAARDDAPNDAWSDQWRQGVLELVWNALARHEQKQPASAAHTLLRLRAEFPDESSEQLAERLSERLGKAVRPDALRQKLRRARLQMVDLLLAEIARGLNDPTPQRIEEELIALGLFEFVRDLLPAEGDS